MEEDIMPETLKQDSHTTHQVGITASTSQSQGQGALTADFNEISICANTDDTVTLPPAVFGTRITIINSGANTLQVFPASGDNLGNGVDTPGSLQANEEVVLYGVDSTNWHVTAISEIAHAEMHDEDNTDAFVVNDAGGDFHAYHNNGLAAGDLLGFTFDAGGGGTSHAITVIVQNGSDITLTTGDAHGLAVGDIVSQTNLADSNYVGVFVVTAVSDTTHYDVTATFGSTGTGTMDQAATLDISAAAAGVYAIFWSMSATSATNNETFDFILCNNAVFITGSKVRRKFGTAADFGSMSGQAVVAIVSGDKLSFALSNQDSAANITIRNISLMAIRL